MNSNFDYSKTYYKITNKEENHNGFSFKDGLNEDIVPFNTEICSAGGIYFSDIENILRYLFYNKIIGYYIREVTVPEDAELCIEKYKYKASKIILGERKELNLDTIKYLEKQGANIHAGVECTLCWASINDYFEVVKYLVEQGADIHADNELPLQQASENGHLEIVKYLVEQGADIHADDELALEWASENGHLEIVKYLVEQGADIHGNDEYALRWASENGRLEVVKYLVEQGADIHAKDDCALDWAYKNKHVEVVKYLQSLN